MLRYCKYLLAGYLAIQQTYWQLGVTGGRKNNITSYLKISLCRNGKLKGRSFLIFLLTSHVWISAVLKSE